LIRPLRRARKTLPTEKWQEKGKVKNQAVELNRKWQIFENWLAALDDFRNWLIREAA
jgi:hypothetical protein